MLKEMFCAKLKKNKVECDLEKIKEVLNDEKIEFKNIFQVDGGTTEEGYGFITWRFYYKK